MAKLIAFYSRADENYFGGQYRYVKVGNTEKVAKMISDLTGADMFKIEQKVPYSANYKECVAQSVKDLKSKARPELFHCRILTITMKFISAIQTTAEQCLWRFILSLKHLILRAKQFIRSALTREADFQTQSMILKILPKVQP